MSTGRRLAKRSIIGTKVCAPGPDGLWYSGVIQDVKTPPTSTVTSATLNDSNTDSSDSSTINSNTKYIVRFDFKTMQSSQDPCYITSMPMNITPNSPKSVIMEARRAAHLQYASPAQTLRRNAMIKEFREGELIGPGFRTILGIQLQPGQRVYLTYNGRETSGDVLEHDMQKDEVTVKILALGNEEPIELKKRLEEVRLLESRRSARLADQDRDTDFARLADMGGDRRRTHSIEVPMPLTPQNNPRKRPPSYTNEEDQCNKVEMDECNAALILMKLSNSPKSPRNGDVWHVSSPYSSSASWSSGSSSPPLSDDGIALLHTNATMLQDASASARLRTISVSTSDEGIDVDFKDDVPRKKRANKSRFKCTYRGCNYTESIQTKIERHIRHAHLGNKKPRRSADESDHEEEFYYTEVEEDDEDVKPSPTSPTLSHRDMARPPHEDPEYQRQIVGNFKNGRVTSHQQPHLNGVVRSIQHGSPGQQYHQVQNHHQQQLQNNNTICMATSPLAHHNYTWPSSIASNNNSTTIVAPTSPHQQQQHSNTLMHHQPTQLHHNGSATLIKRVHPSPRPSQTVAAKAPYPSPPPPAYVQHQLSQQNVTVTVTTSPNQHQHQHQQSPHHQQISTGAITITPTTTNAANINNNNNNNNNSNSNNNNYQTHQQQIHQHNQQQQQQQHQQSQHHSIHHMQQHSPNPNNNMLNGNNAQQQHVLQQQHHHQHQQQHQHQHQQQQHQHQHHTAAINNSTKQAPNSGGNANSPPNRRTRGENKKCRKVYGMLRREQWCTQCKWKKACSRFGD